MSFYQDPEIRDRRMTEILRAIPPRSEIVTDIDQ